MLGSLGRLSCIHVDPSKIRSFFRFVRCCSTAAFRPGIELYGVHVKSSMVFGSELKCFWLEESDL